ncbi:MAG: 50S ribosomal protein L9, partial [Bacteroidales bacterium]|nr:50S ribosomal protein L9 [Bacteroidales bacterium]
AGIEVDKKAVTVPEIKEAGEFEAAVKCYKNVVGNVKLNVVAE